MSSPSDGAAPLTVVVAPNAPVSSTTSAAKPHSSSTPTAVAPASSRVPQLSSRRKTEAIKLCVGGHYFCTTSETLTQKESFFSALLSGSFEVTRVDDGALFIDRDGTHFRHILNYLRDGLIPQHLPQDVRSELAIEAAFYRLDSLVLALDPTNQMLELISDISGDTLREDYEAWLRASNEAECALLGDSLERSISSILKFVRTMVQQGKLSGRVALLVSDAIPATMSFSVRGKVDVITPEGAIRELPLKYHDWAGRHDKIDFVDLQKRAWRQVCDNAAIDPCMRIYEESATAQVAAKQLGRILQSRKIGAQIESKIWFDMSTPLYSSEGVRGDCPIIADFCRAPFLMWSLE